MDVSECLIIIDLDLTIYVIPLLALVVVTADPLLAIEDLLVFFKVDLLAIVTVLLLVVCLCAHITQPEGLVVRVLLSGPETIGLIAIGHILLGADNVFTASQLLLGRLLVDCTA